MARKTISERGAQKLLITIYPDDAERLEEIRKAQKRNISFAQIIRNAINALHKEQCRD